MFKQENKTLYLLAWYKMLFITLFPHFNAFPWWIYRRIASSTNQKYIIISVSAGLDRINLHQNDGHICRLLAILHFILSYYCGNFVNIWHLQLLHWLNTNCNLGHSVNCNTVWVAKVENIFIINDDDGDWADIWRIWYNVRCRLQYWDAGTGF